LVVVSKSSKAAQIQSLDGFFLESCLGKAQSRVVVIQDKRRSMIAKTTCQHCGQHIEFDAEQANQFVARPWWSKQIRLLLTKAGRNPNPTHLAKHTGTTMQSCPDCGELISPRALVCPNCGCAPGVRFRFVWHVIRDVMLVNLIFAAIGLVIYFLLSRSLPLAFIPG
jgi:hypothetical protein